MFEATNSSVVRTYAANANCSFVLHLPVAGARLSARCAAGCPLPVPVCLSVSGARLSVRCGAGCPFPVRVCLQVALAPMTARRS